MSTVAHFTAADYDRMIASGLFDGPQKRRVELIRGEVREMMPMGVRHEDVVDRLMTWSVENVPKAEVRVRVQNSVGLPDLDSVPEPDVAWVVQRDYSRCRPTADDVLLIIEVAESSLDYDTGEKAELYAAAGIKDYWVVDVAAQVVEVRRELEGSRYRSLAAYRDEDPIRPLARPEMAFSPALLFDQPEFAPVGRL